MPILPREPDVFPNNLLDDEEWIDDGDANWWVLYTMARREKDLMRRLLSMEVPFYGPLTPRRTRSPSGRVSTSHVPLFSGYVFLCGSDQQRQQALTTNCISRVLPVHDSMDLIRDLRQIRQLIASDAPLTPEARIQPGTRVRVRCGPLTGVEGVVVKRRGKVRLIVAVQFLQQGASISLEDYQVQSLD